MQIGYWVGWGFFSEQMQKMETWFQKVKNLKQVKIERCFTPNDIGSIKRVELHHFSDVSNTGCSQCSYIRIIGKRNAHWTLVIGKARVAPTKVVTVPHLELVAATVSAAVTSPERGTRFNSIRSSFTLRLTKTLPIMYLGVTRCQNFWNQIGLPDENSWGRELITIQGCPIFTIRDTDVRFLKTTLSQTEKFLDRLTGIGS